MKRALLLCLFIFCLVSTSLAQAPPAPSLHGVITDPSGALIPGALIQLRGPGGEQRQSTNGSGEYSFPTLRPGKYLLRVIAKGFTVSQKEDFEINGPSDLDVQLTIQAEAQVMNVEDEANKVTADPANNGGALVLKDTQLDALSDDPDELSQQLQAMAGPGAGPSGGTIYIDGFTGGNLPPKSSIREIRINSNPFSPEYDRPGFGRIEILTKPGSDQIHGNAFVQYNNEDLNSRSPLLEQSTRPPYKQDFFGFSLTGPIKKNKASFSFDGNYRGTTENAFILATDLNASLAPQTINQAVLTPLTFRTLTPRLDYSINSNNTLIVRYQNTSVTSDNQGVGAFNLSSRSYNTSSTENTLQVTETAVVNTHLVNETRFQFMRSNSAMTGGSNDPALIVDGAFSSGGAQVGNSGTTANHWELTNTSTFTHGTHTVKWGGRISQGFDSSTSMNNFGGTYTFVGAPGPELDANNQPIPGTSLELTALQVYQRTLLFQQQGWTDPQIRAAGGGAYEFSIGAGTPTTSVSLVDIGLFVNDDWKAKQNLTVSYGLRYEAQTNIGDRGDYSPRLGIAWGIDGKGNKAAKTILRTGFGIFYNRVPDSLQLNAIRYNGVTQQSYEIFNPGFFPSIPSLSSLATGLQPQQLQYVSNGIAAPRLYQASVGVDRQINQWARVSVNYIGGRGTHLQLSRDINAPIDGAYPYGNPELRMLTEDTGVSRINQITVVPNINYKKLMLFGFYALSYGKSDAEGQPANPYNVRAEYGPSAFSDVRHRFVVGTTVPLLWKFTISPFFLASSGSPYNITTGRDTIGDGILSQRPALMNLSTSACSGQNLVYEAAFGCFNLDPAPGTPTIGYNYARGPATATLMLRLSRSWSFGGKSEGNANQPQGMMGGPGGGGPPGGGGGGGGRGPGGGGGGGGPMMGGGGPPPGMFGAASGRRYTLTLGVNAMNALNRANYAPPNGDLSSPYFGQYLSLGGGFGPMGGASTYNRKIAVQLRFSF
jgi:hypothetical protein